MIESGFLGLYCDHPECADDEYAEVYFLEDGFQSELELRRHAEKYGWKIVRKEGAPWHSEDFCPEHRPVDPPKPENTIRIEG